MLVIRAGRMESAIWSEVVAVRLDYQHASPWAEGYLTRGDGRRRSLPELCLDHAVDGCGFPSLDARWEERASSTFRP